MNNLAALLHAQGKLGESEALFMETLQWRAGVQPWVPGTLAPLQRMFHSSAEEGGELFEECTS